MKEHLLTAFRYNDFANRKLIEKISMLTDKTECIKLVSHLINSQQKWLTRIQNDAEATNMSWWDPLYSEDQLMMMWENSFNMWINFLSQKTEEQISESIRFTGMDGGLWEAKLADIVLQLNYHSIHHRAQMQTLIRLQGQTPDFLDYIGTVVKKLAVS